MRTRSRLLPLALALSAPWACGDAATSPHAVAADAGVADTSAPTAPSCSDRVTNGAETDVDCGGKTGCAPCAIGLGCQVPADCASGACRDGRCAPPPSIARVTPARAGTAGGASVVVAGAGFQAGGALAFGGVPAVVTAARAGEITATVGPSPGKSGFVAAAFANPDGGRGTLDKALRYYLSEVRTGPAASQAGTLPSNVVARDVDGDGKLDLVAGSQGPSALLARGLGDGTTGAPTAIPLGLGSTYSVVVADMNGDGKLDLVAGDASAGSIAIALGGGGGFDPPRVFASGGASYFVAVADFDGDGKLDVVAPALGAGTAPAFCKGNGDGTLAAPVPLAAGDNTVAALAADLDGDGKVDLVLSRFDAAGTLDVLRGKGDGTFEAAVTYAVGAQPWLPSIGDVDGDGKLDLVVGNLGSGDLSLLRGKGGAAFAVAVTLPGHGRNHATALVDLDDDGDRDLVYASFDDGGVRFRRGKGDGTFEPAIVLAQGAASSVGFALGDMNGDGRPDVCVSQSAAGLLSIFPDASR